MIKGKLHAFCETGTEGVIWSMLEDDRVGYDALHCLEEGDCLTIFDPTDPTKIIWKGFVNLEWERNVISSPYNPDRKQQAIGGLWVHGIQASVEPDDWGNWFYLEYPAELTKNNLGRFYPVESSSIASYHWYGTYNYGGQGADGDLIIKFKSGGYYRYKDVPQKIVDGLISAPSIGAYFHSEIKDKFVTEKVELGDNV